MFCILSGRLFGSNEILKKGDRKQLFSANGTTFYNIIKKAEIFLIQYFDKFWFRFD